MSRLLTADEVAARLGVPKSWVWARARANQIPCVPLGRYRRFREDALEGWIRELEAAGTPLEQRRSTRVRGRSR
jgi:excisionase family DNA binding protein